MTFVKTTWVDESVPDIVAAQLNRIEQGIADAHLGVNIPRVTVLPVAPVDLQEIVFLAAPGVAWHLKYNAASASTYKWEYVGGAALAVEGVGGKVWGTWESTTSLAYTTLTTAGPRIIAPLAGEYDVIGQAVASVQVSMNLAGFILWNTGLAAPTWQFADALTVPAAAGVGNTISGRRLVTVAAGDSFELRYATSSASSSANFYNRCIYATPKRVG